MIPLPSIRMHLKLSTVCRRSEAPEGAIAFLPASCYINTGYRSPSIAYSLSDHRIFQDDPCSLKPFSATHPIIDTYMSQDVRFKRSRDRDPASTRC